MEAGFIALAVGMTIIGVLVGMFVERHKVSKADIQGTIYVYYVDSKSKPSLLLEPSVPIEDITSRKQVMFDVDVIK